MRGFIRKAVVFFGTDPVWSFLLGLAAILAFIGPFGSFEALSLPMRFAYWAPVVLGANVFVRLSHRVAARMVSEASPAKWYVLTTSVFALMFAPAVWAYSALFADDLRDFGSFLFILANVFGLAVIVSALVYVMTREALATDAPVAARPRFYERLPDEAAGTVVHLTVDDHYVQVFMDDGSQYRLLMRLSDAVAEMADVPGFYTHRSHWVSAAHVTEALREKNKDFLLLAGGAKIPVSRTYRDDVAAAGFL